MKNWKGISVPEEEYNYTLASALSELTDVPLKDKKLHVLRYSDIHNLNISKSIGECYCSTVGAVIMLIERHFPFNEKSIMSFHKLISNLPKESNAKITIKSEKRDISKVLEWLDNIIQKIKIGEEKPSILSNMPYKLSKDDCEELKKEYDSDYTGIKLALSGEEYAIEAYSSYSKWELNRLFAFYQSLYEFLDQKPERKERKKRRIDVSKLAAKVKYLQHSEKLSVKSIHPEEIHNSKMVLVFEEDSNTIRIYSGKLSVKGTTIIGFDEAVSKKMRDISQVKKLLAASSNVIKNRFDEFQEPKKTVTGRLNDRCVILRKV